MGFFLASLPFLGALVLWPSGIEEVLAAAVGDRESSLTTLLSGVGLSIILWVLIAGMTRRLHDIGASAWWLLLCVPLFPFADLILLFAPGQKRENRFGA